MATQGDISMADALMKQLLQKIIKAKNDVAAFLEGLSPKFLMINIGSVIPPGVVPLLLLKN
jgi:hypothetical protein